MKHILILSLLAIGLAANAQSVTTKKEVYCDKTEDMLSILKSEKFEETPIWLGKGDGKAPNYSLFVNTETKTWTIIQFNNELACVLGSGESYKTITKKSYT
jgi:hypothetical protein